MVMRNNVRQRRRERIQQLAGVRPAGRESESKADAVRNGEESNLPAAYGDIYPNHEDVWEGAPAQETGDLDPNPGNRLAAMPEEAWPPASASAASDYGSYGTPYGTAYEEPDPERWWKEKQRRERSYPSGRAPSSGGKIGLPPAAPPSEGGAPRFTFGHVPGSQPASRDPRPATSGYGPNGGGGPSGTGPIGSLSNLSPYGGLSGRPGWDDVPPYGGDGNGMRRFMSGFMARVAIAAALFGALWAWTNWELPGSGEVRGWTIRTVTEDMNFAAVEAWYERTFGGTPSFLPIFQHEDETQAVSATWSRADTVPPLSGRIVLSFAQSGTGIRLAAPAGTPIKAVHTGRVTQVTLDDQGLATIKIQHTNNVVSVYGHVAKPAVKANDWVEAGRPLGEVISASGGSGGEGTLEFAMQSGGKPIDPAEVVPLD